MKQTLVLTAVVVRDYDEALDFYVHTLGFTLVEETYIPEQDKRWLSSRGGYSRPTPGCGKSS